MVRTSKVFIVTLNLLAYIFNHLELIKNSSLYFVIRLSVFKFTFSFQKLTFQFDSKSFATIIHGLSDS